MQRLLYCFSFCLLVLLSCKSENEESSNEDVFEVNIRLDKDPGQISPFFAPTTIGRHIYQYLFLPLADYHPEKVELYPILIKEIPKGYITESDGIETIAYDVEFKDGVKWSDGQNLTANDYLFTWQVVKHGSSKATAWQPYFANIIDVKLNKENPSKFTIICNPDYMLSKETALTTSLIAEHQFDAHNYLKNNRDQDLNVDSTAINIIEAVNESVNEKEGIVQLGPYKITSAETNEYLVLDRKENYWGKKYDENPFLQASPSRLIFKIVPDELSAETMAKEAKLDFMQFKSSDAFLNLRDDNNFNKDWSFHTPQLMFYFYIALNNAKGHLKDKNVRKAMAHLLDVDDLIQTLDGGLGARTTGHFHPTKPYYNEALEPIKYNLERAEELLETSGWIKTGNQEFRQKEIDGKLNSLRLDLLITGAELGKNIALVFKEEAKKAGVDINIVTKPSALMRKENFANYNYDMAALAAGQDITPDDPYPVWHSDNAKPGTRNITGYGKSETDKLIEEIRTTRDTEKRKIAYFKLQEIMYDDQPMIFLYSPLLKFVSSKKLELTTSPKRPGYFANTFKLAE